MQMNPQVKLLFEVLYGEDFLKINELTTRLQVSEKTVRSLLKRLEEALEGQGALIERKYGEGYRLKITDKETFGRFLEQQHKRYIPDTPERRSQYLAAELILNGDYIKVEELCSRYYVSRKTISADLKQAERILSMFNLGLERKPRYGIRIAGGEFGCRQCLAFLLRRSGRHLYDDVSAEFIPESEAVKVLAEGLNTGSYEIYDDEFSELILQLRIGIFRYGRGFEVTLEEFDSQDYLQEKDIQTAEKCARTLEKIQGTALPVGEIKYLAVQFSGKRGLYAVNDENLVVDMEINRLVNEMLDYIYKLFKLDFSRDFDLQTALRKHMVSLRVRLKYHLTLKNSMLKEIREIYSFSYGVAAQAAMVLSSHFHTIVPEAEIGYLALCFALAMERRKKTRYRRNIVLVCATGGGSAKLFEYRFRECFGDYLNQVTVCSSMELEKIDFKDIDCIFSTVPITNRVPVPVYQIQYFLDTAHIRQVKNILGDVRKDDDVSRYFPEDLFFADLEGTSRKEVLEYLCTLVEQRRELPADFKEQVFKREEMMQTDLIPMVAMPHPCLPMTDETFVAVAVLKKPVYWHMNQVQVVFLLSISKGREDMEHFYKTALGLMMNEEAIKRLASEKSYSAFLEMIREAERQARS